MRTGSWSMKWAERDESLSLAIFDISNRQATPMPFSQRTRLGVILVSASGLL
jgi:hypothetical protein